ncbi:MAG: hypothetical protein KKD25_09045 [Gammaproteobacteria bacterium]|jgi:hypothetical protein|nr:hypothetical protein [Gammaproteobacteria bacterium]MBU0769821.1 hypothetical protein [Gammaproteobacteria bacterium]MBU0856600.1 hypothetical protein [Gammaproteobacteria bacterium]MBU1847506.1 hypothetical protein [Gammaproteobacteria bacterium]
MCPFLRSLLTLLLLVALPLQGFAAAAMTHCQPAPHVDGHAMHVMDDDVAAADHDMPPHDKHRCSACASCCVGSVLMPPALVLPSCFLLYERPLMTRAGPPAFLTEGTERPPRSTFA